MNLKELRHIKHLVKKSLLKRVGQDLLSDQTKRLDSVNYHMYGDSFYAILCEIYCSYYSQVSVVNRNRSLLKVTILEYINIYTGGTTFEQQIEVACPQIFVGA